MRIAGTIEILKRSFPAAALLELLAMLVGMTAQSHLIPF